MPLYEYSCEKCGKVFEVMQKFSDEPLQVHEGCGGKPDRLLSAPALHFKGSGFYITDYAKSGATGESAEKKSESKTTDGASAEGAKSGPAKTESSSKADSGSSSSSSTTTPTTAGSTKGDS